MIRAWLVPLLLPILQGLLGGRAFPLPHTVKVLAVVIPVTAASNREEEEAAFKTGSVEGLFASKERTTSLVASGFTEEW
jgi:hypothetical protein